MNSLREGFFEHGRLDDCPVYDLHGHMGPFLGAHLPSAGLDCLVPSMDRAGVRLLVFCHHAALFAPDIGNRANVEVVRRFPDRLRAYCAVNPNYSDAIRRDLDAFDDYPDVFVGLKMLADYHQVPLTDDRYRPAWEFANDRELPVLMHTWGGSAFNGADNVRACAREYPNAKLLMGHSLHDQPNQAIEIANEFPNVYYELCAVLDERGVVESFVAESGSERILFGTDFPWFDFHYYIGAVLGADITEDDRRNILYRNARKLLGAGL